jgi:3-oxoacyl-[acyl-carrier-protein] synthase III
MPAYITATGVALPNNPVPNEKIESILGKVGNARPGVRTLILRRNGIKWRYYAIDPQTGKATHNNAQLTAEAIRVLAASAGLDAEAVPLLVCGTSAPDQLIPSHAAMVHGLLDWPPIEVASMAGVCCSSMTALKYACTAVLAGNAAAAVVTGSELASSGLRASQFYAPPEGEVSDNNPYLGFNQEFLRFMLSDGAGALLVEDQPRRQGPALRIDWIDIRSFANELPVCMYYGAAKQPDGVLRGWREEEEGAAAVLAKRYFNVSQDVNVLENIVNVSGRFFAEVVKRRQLKPECVDWLLPHLSSMFFQQPIYDSLTAGGFAVPMEKWFTNLKYKGNTGSASMFIMLDELVKSGKLKRGDRLLCAIPESARFTFACMHLTVE